MNRITNLFNTKKNGILSVFFTAGYPNLDDTTKILKELEDKGIDMVEIGIPFAIIPLMKYTHDRSLMGDYVDGPVKFAINMVVVSLIVALNVILVILTLSGRS